MLGILINNLIAIIIHIMLSIAGFFMAYAIWSDWSLAIYFTYVAVASCVYFAVGYIFLKDAGNKTKNAISVSALFILILLLPIVYRELSGSYYALTAYFLPALILGMNLHYSNRFLLTVSFVLMSAVPSLLILLGLNARIKRNKATEK